MTLKCKLTTKQNDDLFLSKMSFLGYAWVDVKINIFLIWWIDSSANLSLVEGIMDNSKLCRITHCADSECRLLTEKETECGTFTASVKKDKCSLTFQGTKKDDIGSYTCLLVQGTEVKEGKIYHQIL